MRLIVSLFCICVSSYGTVVELSGAETANTDLLEWWIHGCCAVFLYSVSYWRSGRLTSSSDVMFAIFVE